MSPFQRMRPYFLDLHKLPDCPSSEILIVFRFKGVFGSILNTFLLFKLINSFPLKIIKLETSKTLSLTVKMVLFFTLNNKVPVSNKIAVVSFE